VKTHKHPAAELALGLVDLALRPLVALVVVGLVVGIPLALVVALVRLALG